MTGTKNKVIDGEVVDGEKKPKTKALATLGNKTISFNAENLISQAIASGASVETMERLLAMRKSLKEEYAKEEFDRAMAEFQGECPVIKKKKAGGKTKSGTVAYHYAPLEDIVAQVKDLIQKNGFSYMIKTETGKDSVKAYCIVKHKSGHSETSDMGGPLGTKTDIMSFPQVTAAALTFYKRYAFCNAFGILTGDDDNDANIVKKDSEKVETKKPQTQVDYIKQLKSALFKAGAVTETEAVEKYNDYTGESIKSIKVGQERAKQMVWNFLNSPMGSKLKKK